MSGDLAQDLGKVALFGGLDHAARERLAARCALRQFDAGAQIIDRQSESSEVFFLLDGRVRVVNYSLSGREITFDDISVGGCFGQLAAIDGAPRSAAVQALTPVTLVALGAADFVELLRQDADVALGLLRELVKIVRTSTDRIMDLSTLGANNRVHGELLRLAREGVRNDNQALIAPAPLHGDIAARVSTTRETVARVIGDLTREGIVAKQRNGLQIVDIERLEHMVEAVRGD